MLTFRNMYAIRNLDKLIAVLPEWRDRDVAFITGMVWTDNTDLTLTLLSQERKDGTWPDFGLPFVEATVTFKAVSLLNIKFSHLAYQQLMDFNIRGLDDDDWADGKYKVCDLNADTISFYCDEIVVGAVDGDVEFDRFY